MGPSPALPRGLTLVELMVTITIIAILATLFLGALVNAQNDAKAMKTKSMIVKLNNLIMPRYELYRTRRVPMQIQGTVSGTGASLLVAQDRLNALHDIMRMEMPDRWTDVLDGPITFTWYNPTSGTTSGAYIPRPALNQAYLNAYFAVVNNPANPHAINPATASAPYWPTDPAFASTLTNYEGAECLYMMVSLGFVDELGGRDLFNESSIGDVDQDGFPEFLDAWGTPIRFLRWAPGFTDSELQGAGGIQILPNGGGSPTTSLTVIGSTNGIHAHGLSNRNNAYAGKTITVYTPHPSGTGKGTTQSATIASSSYVLSGTSTTTTFTLASPGLATALCRVARHSESTPTRSIRFAAIPTRRPPTYMGQRTTFPSRSIR